MDGGRPDIDLDGLLAHAGWLRGLARSLVADAALADDLSQETWLAALKRPPVEDRNLRGWLARTLKNALRQERRSEGGRKAREQAAEARAEPGSAELAQRVEAQRELASLVLRLAEPHRSTVIRRYYEGLSAAEIARRDGVPAGTVRWRLHTALGELRTELDARAGGERRAWVLSLSPVAGIGGTATGSAAVVQGALAMKLSTKMALTAAVIIALAGLGSLAVLRRSEPGPSTSTAVTARLGEAPVASAGDGDAGAVPVPGGERRALATSPPAPRLRASGTVMNLPDPRSGGTPTPAAGVGVEGRLQPPTGLFDEADPEATAITDAQGSFELEWDDPGVRPLELYCSARGDDVYRHAAYRLRPRPQFTAETNALMDLRLERPVHGSLEGETVAADGTPLADVLVSIEHFEGGRTTLTALSDDHGRFSIERFSREGTNYALAAEGAGCVLVDASPIRMRKEGGWEPLRIVLSRTGVLVVETRDGAGALFEGAWVDVDISEHEREGRREQEYWTGESGRESLRVRSDAKGRAVFSSAWAEKMLQVSVRSDAAGARGERMRAGRLVGSPLQGSQAIVVPAEGRLELIANLEAPPRVRGLVLRADGSPAAGARFALRPSDWSLPGLYLRDGQADGQGRFDVLLEASILPHRAVITANEVSLVDFAPTGNAASRTLSISGQAGEVIDVELVLEPTLSIAGNVRTAAGEPAVGWVRALAEGNFERIDEPLASGEATIAEDGSFRLQGLRAGVYDLLVEPRAALGSATSFARQSFPNIEAGRTDVELRLSERELVHVDVEASATGAGVASMVVLVGKHRPLAGPSTAGSSPAREATFHGPHGWPLGPTLLPIHGRRVRDAGGTTELLYTSASPVAGSSASLPVFEPGWYWIGVQAFDADKRPFFPTGTGCAYLEPGHYSFRFELDPTADVQGRLVMEAPDPDLCVALADPAGELVPLRRASSSLDLVLEAGAGGDFRLEAVPVGSFVLRVGTDEELRAGRWQHAQPIEIGVADNPPLRVELP